MNFLRNNIINKIIIFISKTETDINTISLFSIVLFLFFILLYSNLIFIQFSFFEIFKVFISFIILSLILVATFNASIFKEKIKFNILNLIFSFFLFIFLLLILFSPNDAFYSYYRTFPLLDIETGFGWIEDTAFHVSIINSFLNFNYPSIGQHDTPIIVYHVLSHFIDSIILYYSGVDPWDSYGLFFFYKSSFFLIFILIFITIVCKNKNFIYFIFSIFLITPIIVGTWHAIGSHALWFTSYLIIIASVFIFKILSKDEVLFKDYVILSLILITVSLGKISSGFSYTLLIGFILFIKNYKNYKVYLFGFGMLLFFYGYNSMFEKANVVLNFNTDDILDILSLKMPFYYDQLDQIYTIIFLTFIVGYLFNSKIIKIICFSGLLSTLILVVIISMKMNFNAMDKWYFIYGLNSTLIILSYISFIKYIEINLFRKYNLIFYFILFIIILISINNLNTTKFNLYNINYETMKYVKYNFNNHNFLKLDEKIKFEEEITLKKKILSNNIEKLPLDNRPLVKFKSKLYEFMFVNNLKKKDTLLYIPKEILENDFDQFNGQKWARGMMIYAITGVPLINGIYSLKNNFGHSSYTENSLWINRNLFNISEACKFNKNIVILEDYQELEFTLIKCK